MPIYPTTTFYSDPSGQGDVLYTRYGNGPNQAVLEQRLASLDGAEDALVTASGMSAMAIALLSVLRAGDHVVATDAIYGGTRALLSRELSRLGIETTYADMFSAGCAPTPAWCWGKRRPTRCCASWTCSPSRTRRTRTAPP